MVGALCSRGLEVFRLLVYAIYGRKFHRRNSIVYLGNDIEDCVKELCTCDTFQMLKRSGFNERINTNKYMHL